MGLVDSSAVQLGRYKNTLYKKKLLPPSSGQNLIQYEDRIDSPLKVSIFAYNPLPHKMYCYILMSSNATSRCLLATTHFI
jgi:hypothetical protein